MTPLNDDARNFLAALDQAQIEADPFRHWRLAGVLTKEAIQSLSTLPIAEPEDFIFDGRRESNNAKRVFFNPDMRRRFPSAAKLAEALQSKAVTGAIEAACATKLAGTYLRIEFCQDREGFWLEPHTDIGPKKFTMQVYLNEGESAEAWGTDLFDSNRQWRRSVPAGFNSGLIFIPGGNSWHGFRARKIDGLRKSLIVNFVSDEWRNRHELAFPDAPI